MTGLVKVHEKRKHGNPFPPGNNYYFSFKLPSVMNKQNVAAINIHEIITSEEEKNQIKKPSWTVFFRNDGKSIFVLAVPMNIVPEGIIKENCIEITKANYFLDSLLENANKIRNKFDSDENLNVSIIKIGENTIGFIVDNLPEQFISAIPGKYEFNIPIEVQFDNKPIKRTLYVAFENTTNSISVRIRNEEKNSSIGINNSEELASIFEYM